MVVEHQHLPEKISIPGRGLIVHDHEQRLDKESLESVDMALRLNSPLAHGRKKV